MDTQLMLRNVYKETEHLPKGEVKLKWEYSD